MSDERIKAAEGLPGAVHVGRWQVTAHHEGRFIALALKVGDQELAVFLSPFDTTLVCDALQDAARAVVARQDGGGGAASGGGS